MSQTPLDWWKYYINVGETLVGITYNIGLRIINKFPKSKLQKKQFNKYK
jgi:hypothetical protein